MTCRSVRRTTRTTLNAFKTGEIAGAWVPEPWATRLVTEGGGKILVDEADLWPNGKYVTTQLIVTTSFLKEHPDMVKKLVAGAGRGEQVHRRPTRSTPRPTCRRASSRSPARRSRATW